MATQVEPPSSSSSYLPRYSYDVFLSFRGEDTRTNFTDHLYNALLDKGIRTFRDNDEIERGESLKPELDKAIKESRIAIIVFSKNYASSPWCLDEVLMILEQRKIDSQHVVWPVFYDVTPSEVRKQTGRTGEVFDRYKEGSKFSEKIKSWRAALKEVADLAGMELKNQADRHEAEFIKNIIKVIGAKLRRTPLFVAPILVGMESRAKYINKWLKDDSSEVSLLGICGMGGIGKTTLAKFVYNHNFENFDGSCFLADIREKSGNPDQLVALQTQILSIVNKKHSNICTTHEGIVKIKEAISNKRVLLVLDDVDQTDQLDEIFGMQDWFHRGSKIIITTRNERSLKHHEIFKVEELGHSESVQLFSFYAFGEDHPTAGYVELTERIVRTCKGLPLALQVIGSSLSGRTIPQWESEVKKLEAIPHKKNLDKLKVSYICLEEEEDKRLFLDISCFFVGKDKDYTVKILDSGIDTHADVRIQNLIDRYLLAIDSCNKLTMHQLLQDMGRHIIKQESHVPEGRSRLWHQEEVYSVVKSEMGTTKIEGLILDMRVMTKNDNVARKQRYEESLNQDTFFTGICSFLHCFGCFSFIFGENLSSDFRNQSFNLRTEGFEKMENLRLLKLNYTQVRGCYDNFPKKLAWLCWHGYPQKNMPSELSLENLVALDLRHSQLEAVWSGPKFLGSLKILNLSYSERLVKTPNFRGLPNLERLILKGCVSLLEISESIEFLERLDLLDLTNCNNIRKLPRNLHKLKSVETFIFSGCWTLFADALVTQNDNRRGDHWQTSSLLAQARQQLERLQILSSSLPRSLRSLDLSNCNLSDGSLPHAFGSLSLLEDLNLSLNLFCNLPDCIRNLSNLRCLTLMACYSLDSALNLPNNLTKLNFFLCKSLRKIAFQSAPHQLNEIGISHCRNVVEIEGLLKREPIGNVDGRITRNLGIDIESIQNLDVQHMGLLESLRDPVQGFYEYGIFSTYVPGGEIPSCFSEKKKGSSLSFTVSSVPNFRIQCLNIFTVYAFCYEREKFYHVALKIENRTKDLTWVYSPLYFGFPDKDKDMRWFSQWNFGNQVEGGDELVVSVYLRDGLEVKECGISIVYEEEEDNGVVEVYNNNKYFHWNEVVGGDLSHLELRAGSYFLNRHLYESTSDDREWTFYRDLFAKTLDIEELQKRDVRCALEKYW